MNKKIIVGIVIGVTVAILALVLGLVFGLRKKPVPPECVPHYGVDGTATIPAYCPNPDNSSPTLPAITQTTTYSGCNFTAQSQKLEIGDNTLNFHPQSLRVPPWYTVEVYESANKVGNKKIIYTNDNGMDIDCQDLNMASIAIIKVTKGTANLV